MLPITASNPFKWRHYPGDIILWCARWYLRYPISFKHTSEMAAERGLLIDASCIWRWVQVFRRERPARVMRRPRSSSTISVVTKQCRRAAKETSSTDINAQHLTFT
jgi:transposase-like protein